MSLEKIYNIADKCIFITTGGHQDVRFESGVGEYKRNDLYISLVEIDDYNYSILLREKGKVVLDADIEYYGDDDDFDYSTLAEDENYPERIKGVIRKYKQGPWEDKILHLVKET